MRSRLGKFDEAAVDAIKRVVRLRDELEQAGRPDGEIVQLSRQQWDDALDNIDVIARCICDLASGV
jgi:hypothetical protein